jgi:hypothetical protein
LELRRQWRNFGHQQPFREHTSLFPRCFACSQLYEAIRSSKDHRVTNYKKAKATVLTSTKVNSTCTTRTNLSAWFAQSVCIHGATAPEDGRTRACLQISLRLLWVLFDICGLIGFEGKYFLPNSATKMDPSMGRGQPQSSAVPPPLQLAALCTSARMFRIMKSGWMLPLGILVSTRFSKLAVSGLGKTRVLRFRRFCRRLLSMLDARQYKRLQAHVVDNTRFTLHPSMTI